jgi:hypothetical protein
MKLPSFASATGYHSSAYHSAPPDACCAEAEWRAFQRVLVDAIECVIDQAVICSAPDVDDVLALEHLRTIVRAHFAGIAVPIQMAEFLHALAIVLTGFQLEPRGRRAHPPRDGSPMGVASERLRHVAHAAVSAQQQPAPVSAEEAFTTYPQEPSPRRRQRATKRRPTKDETPKAA